MKSRSNKAILDELGKIWGEDDSFERREIKIEENTKKEVRLRFGRMYDAPPCNLTHLKALSEFFDTDNINDERFSHGGCESCDYGSEYGFTLVIKP